MFEDFFIILFISSIFWAIYLLIITILNVVIAQFMFIPIVDDLEAWLTLPAVITAIIVMKYNAKISETSIPDAKWKEYCNNVAIYLQHNKPDEYLENDNVKTYMNGSSIRILNKKNNKMFELTEKNEKENNLTTIWYIIQMHFNKYISYEGLKRWCNRRAIKYINIKNIRDGRMI